MSKLTIVRKALETNPNVAIVNVKEKDYPIVATNDGPIPDIAWGFFHYTVDLWVAPKGGLYTADELQAFMLGLVPGLQPSQKDDFMQHDGKLYFGKLYFDERFEERKTVTLINEEDGSRTIDTDVAKEYLRRTWVRPLPSEAFARDVLSGKLKYFVNSANLSDLNSYRQNQTNQPNRANLFRRLVRI